MTDTLRPHRRDRCQSCGRYAFDVDDDYCMACGWSPGLHLMQPIIALAVGLVVIGTIAWLWSRLG